MSEDLEDIPAETPLSPEEAVLRRHRREKKDLQGKILAMKKTVTKNDKKKKKDISSEIERLEADLAAKHKVELDSFQIIRVGEKKSNELPLPIEERVAEISLEDVVKKIALGESSPTPGSPRMSKARKRREKKSFEEREKQKRIDQESQELVESSDRKKEDNRLQEILGEMKLEIYNIPSDGHCLYAAVSHQLGYHGSQGLSQDVATLRTQVSSYLLKNRDDFINYLEENLVNSQEEFHRYCQDIKDTSCWGGQIEIQVLSKILGKQIRVVQAEGPCLVFGEEYPKPSLDLIFHRHMLQLGAHYNSAISQTDLKSAE